MSRQKLKWFVTCLVYRSSVGNGAQDGFSVELSLRAIRAESEEAAREKALLLGKEEEVSYKNYLGETVCWKFICVLDIQELPSDKLTEGDELWGATFRAQSDGKLSLKEILSSRR